MANNIEEMRFMNDVKDAIDERVRCARYRADAQRKHIRALENITFNKDGSISGAEYDDTERWLTCADGDTMVDCEMSWRYIPESDPRRTKGYDDPSRLVKGAPDELIYIYDFDDIKEEVKREKERYESRAAECDAIADAIQEYVIRLAEACLPLFEVAEDTGTDDVDVSIALREASADVFTLLKRDMLGLYDNEDWTEYVPA